jgi:hypothetical protein
MNRLGMPRALLEKIEQLRVLEDSRPIQMRLHAPSCMRPQGDSRARWNPEYGFQRSGRERRLDFRVGFGFDGVTFSTKIQ